MSSKSTIITLLTDFGLSDGYVGVMKGVIAQINPQLTVVDLTHQVPPQNITAARFCLMNTYSYFPVGTVHLAVIDPDVGSQRRGIALQLQTGFFVGPDNGLVSGILTQDTVVAAVELTNPSYWRVSQPSHTFHGRDIFAPVAAYLASDTPIDALGTLIEPESLVQLPIPNCTPSVVNVEGCIQYVDQFGNLITNIPGTYVQGQSWAILIKDQPQNSVSSWQQDTLIPSGDTYSDAQPGHLVALIGSHGWVEIAANRGNAQSQLALNWGSRVQVLFNPT